MFYDARQDSHRQTREKVLKLPLRMLVTTHVIVAASLGLTLAPDQPWLAFLLGFLSHLLIDIIPHGDTQIYQAYTRGEGVARAQAYTGIDAALAIIMTAWILNQPFADGVRLSTSWAIAGGALPDILVGIREYFKVVALEGFRKFHFFFHDLISKRYGDVPLLVGLGIEGAIIASLLVVRW